MLELLVENIGDSAGKSHLTESGVQTTDIADRLFTCLFCRPNLRIIIGCGDCFSCVLSTYPFLLPVVSAQTTLIVEGKEIGILPTHAAGSPSETFVKVQRTPARGETLHREQ